MGVRRSAAGVVLLFLVACGGDPPPVSDDEWFRAWDGVVDLVPAQDALDEADPSEQCGRTLARLREARPALPSPPRPALEGPVERWFEIAEDMFFECPPDGGTIASFADGYDELSTLEAEIDTIRETSS